MYISSQCLLMHEYCENALLKLHQPMILQNFVSCKHLAKLFMIMIVVYNDFLQNHPKLT